MSSESKTPQDWKRQQMELCIGGFRQGTREWRDEPQTFPADGCRIALSRNFPGIIEETMVASWCFIAYYLRTRPGEEQRWHITYRRDIDELPRARKIRKDREGRQQY